MDKLQFNLQPWNNDSSPALNAENLNYVNNTIHKNLSAINNLIGEADDLANRINTLTLENINNTSSNVVIGTTTPASLPSQGNYHLLRTLVVARSGFSSDYPKDFIPLKGEICIIYPNISSTDSQLGIKVGDGSTTWENLPLFKGERGFKGDTGYSPKITVLRTDTEDYGEAADVDVTTADNGDISLTFKIPAGPFTELGIGSVNTLDPTSTASVTISDVKDHPEQKNLNFGIPKGYKGDKGDAATIRVGTVTALLPGSTPIVENRGTSTNAIFDFKIPQGQGISILGALESEAQLPPSGSPGDAYLINGNLYVWNELDTEWDNVGNIQGPRGKQGPQGDQGISISSVTQTTTSDESSGDNIITCLLSDGTKSTFIIKNGAKGDPGHGINIVASLDSVEELPSTGDAGDAYLINGNLYVWNELDTEWTNVGNIQGPQGEQGPPGHGINIVASLDSVEELPSTGDAGDAYLINGNLYVWSGSEWENVGHIQGPQGKQGPPGDQGISISSVTQTTTSSESGGDNIITCTLSNGNESTFTIKNGAKGAPGSDATIVWQTF